MYGFEVLCEISRLPFEISHTIFNPYISFSEVLIFDNLQYKLWRLKS